MKFTTEQRLDDGVLEREFTLGEIPGILWTPGSASAPAPLILLGPPGGLHKMHPPLGARARHPAAGGPGPGTRGRRVPPPPPSSSPGALTGPVPPPPRRPAPTWAGRWRPTSRST